MEESRLEICFTAEEWKRWIEKAIHQQYQRYITLIREGYISWENEAREFAERYGFPIEEIEKAIEIGKIRERKYF